MISNGLKIYLSIFCLQLIPVVAKAEGMPDLCIGKICLGVKAVNEKSLVSEWGDGRKRLGRGNDASIIKRCFYDESQNIWVEFTFDKHSAGTELSDIFVSSQPLCEKTFLPKRPFPKLATNSGLAIGSLEQEVIQAKGKPSRIVDAVEREKKTPEHFRGTYRSSIYGASVLVYDYAERNDNEMNYFYLSDGKVKTVWLSISE